MPIGSIGASGANAAAFGYAVGANNIANQQSRAVQPGENAQAGQDAQQPGFRPQDAQQSSVAGGGVTAFARPVNPASIPVLQADGSEGALPNVDPAREQAGLIRSQRAYEANLATVRAADEQARTTLSLVS